ncbi:hypothetical protein NPIL_279141, partial [Nephila pilipes]
DVHQPLEKGDDVHQPLVHAARIKALYSAFMGADEKGDDVHQPLVHTARIKALYSALMGADEILPVCFTPRFLAIAIGGDENCSEEKPLSSGRKKKLGRNKGTGRKLPHSYSGAKPKKKLRGKKLSKS